MFDLRRTGGETRREGRQIVVRDHRKGRNSFVNKMLENETTPCKANQLVVSSFYRIKFKVILS